MARKGLRPFLLDPDSRTTHNRNHNHNHNSSIESVDIDPAQQDFLSLPSPYHEGNFSFPSPSRSAAPASPLTSPRTTGSTAFSSIFNRFRYSKINSDSESAASTKAGAAAADDDESEEAELSRTRKKRSKHIHWSEYEETPADRWFTVLFLLLLLSVLFSFFLLFNGPPNSIAIHAQSNKDPLPHEGFRFKQHGKNYTCYKTHTTTFNANYEFSNTFGAYDYLWGELQGKSNGIVYTSLNRPDGKTRKSGLAMFHQLDCLAKLRSVIQALQIGETHKDVDVGEHHGYWPHCFDYLKQVIMCNADDNVEVSEVKGGRWVTSGFGSVKECRDASWLYDVTKCGEGGCKGTAFFNEKGFMEKVHREEEEVVDKWRKEHESEM